MSDCPYCNNKDTQLYYYTNLPFYVWLLSSGEKNFMVPVEIYLCPNCWYAFNRNPLPEEYIKKLYDDNHFIPSTDTHYPQRGDFYNIVKANTNKNDCIIEIGSSNGYLLTLLSDCGYKYLGEINPDPRIDGRIPIQMKNIDLSWDISYRSDIDVFLFDNVFEHLEKPWEYLKIVSNRLTKNGKIIMEFPGYCSCLHHQHVSFFTLPFLHTISKESGLTMNVVFHGSSTVTRVIFQKEGSRDKKSHSLGPVELEEEKNKILLNTQKVRKDFINRKTKLNSFLQNTSGEKVYWWGADMWAASLFSYIEQEWLDENINFKFIESDESKEGLTFFPASAKVFSAEKTLKNMNIKYLVLASQSINEMKQKLIEWNCRVENVFHV